ncbi:valine--tRNA ligase [Haladaptatus sp. F3-133]|jgi:valyl-tRNA synthetase|uniref:Valine--tRNA ligase n=1 Tax=Halorutilus salinus TaxID=2487751 RepID=A0A9Q4C495_9EURY|nr:valine--tRNA ligase [Halorutilus salinus]MCX2818998.1 valine--tRNA ligase [Halorutilus salinus]
MDIPKSYDASSAEERWCEEWDDDLYAFDEDDDAPEYVIDTPPPYPTGNLHIGNALGWCYMDFAARYRRLQGYNVLFPQGWDCHGLPTEVKVEENKGVKKSEVPRDEFRGMCVDHTYEMIDEMKETMETLGFSQDWGHEYVTMEPEYWGETQRSFVEMADEGYAYRDHHPVNWCPRCETAIADAEVEREERDGTLVYLTFPGVDEGGEGIEIATTRPELLSACGAVAVEPGGEWSDHVGDTVEVPLFGQEVDVIEDEEVDSEFGTGAVMICTFGDKQDVEWWLEYDLELREAFTREGTLTGLADAYEGMTVDEAKEAITDDLRDEGYVYDSEAVDQSVGVCWRCDTPIEILAEEQWFIEVRQEEILEKAREVDWIPDHAYTRFEDWTEGMEWDWVISRQRVFATPFPVWYCDDCGAPYVADEEELPVDPTEEEPAGDCADCGGDAFTPEEDVMDTWMDSSITAMYVGGWADGFREDADFSPTQLREQGHDIIRTWAFYTVLRTTALEDEIPWEDALVNGMVFGDDGNKMSKSRGNFVQPEEVVDEYGADAFRQAMASAGRPGSDIQFQWKEVERASKFLTKTWNIHRFAVPHVAKDVYDYDPDDPPELRLADRWILSRLTRVLDGVEEDMDAYRYDSALQAIREFTWNELADDYLELVKGRLYEEDGEGNQAVRWTLRTVLEAVAVSVSPFAPFFAEELYDAFYDGSVHTADWRDVDMLDESAEEKGDVLAGVVASVRRWKSDEGMALNAEIGRVEVYTDGGFDGSDASNALNADVVVKDGEPELEEVPVELDPDMSILGPRFRDSAGEVVGALKKRDPAEVAREKEDGTVGVEVDGETVGIDADAVEVVNELRSGGEEVEAVETEGATVLVFR